MSDKGNSFIFHILCKYYHFVGIIRQYLTKACRHKSGRTGCNHLFFKKLKINGVWANRVKMGFTFQPYNVKFLKNIIISIPNSRLNFPSTDFFFFFFLIKLLTKKHLVVFKCFFCEIHLSQISDNYSI